MARACLIKRNNKRIRNYKNWKQKRAKAIAIIKDPEASFEEKLLAQKLLQETKNGSKVRVRNRCKLTGRPRGNYRKFGLSRIVLRELFERGDIPGLVKSSW